MHEPIQPHLVAFVLFACFMKLKYRSEWDEQARPARDTDGELKSARPSESAQTDANIGMPTSQSGQSTRITAE